MVSMALAGTALAQGKMDGMHNMQGHKMDANMSAKMAMVKSHPEVVKTMMMGLTKDEQMTAHEHMMKMSSSEMAILMKRGSLCMKDNHKSLMGMKESDKLMHDHMMSGLSMSEKSTMEGMMKKMTPKEKAVATKMVTNCCNYGMKHAK
jgi:hypothetical protein